MIISNRLSIDYRITAIDDIAGLRDHILDFKLPKKIVRTREKVWQGLFDKYLEEVHIFSLLRSMFEILLTT